MPLPKNDAATREAQAQFDRHLDRRALPVARRAYEEAELKMVHAVHTAAKLGASKGTINMVIRNHQIEMAKSLSRQVAGAADETHRDAIHGYSHFIAHVDGRQNILVNNATAYEQALRRRSGRIRSLVDHSSFNLAAAVAKKIEHDVLKAPALPIVVQLNEHEHAARPIHESPMELANKVETAAAESEWMVDRMTLTEMAAAYNGGKLSAGEQLVGSVPGLFNRWVEHVSDATWEPTDKKTAHDSIYLHAQVALPGGMFSMPDDDKSGEFQGDEWEGPPNRPHDRAILVPWRKEWGSPAWLNVGGRRVWLIRGKGPAGAKRHKR